MTIKELKAILDSNFKEDEEVKIVLSIPSIGPTATSKVESATYGFDWDKGLLLRPSERLVVKDDKQSVYEDAQDLLMRIATESYTVKNEKYEHRRAKQILLKHGFTEEKIRSYVHLYHKNPIIK